jgi:hypothetical protein
VTNAASIQVETTPTFTRSFEALLTEAAALGGPALTDPALFGPVFGLGALRDGVDFADTLDQEGWEAIYCRLCGAAGAAMPPLAQFHEQARAEDGVTLIALAHLPYRKPRRQLAQAILKARREDTAIVLPADTALADLFVTKTTFIASAILAPRHWAFQRLPDRHVGLPLRFRLSPEFHVSAGPPPARVEIDFDDGEGLREVGWSEDIRIDYEEAGLRRIELRAHYPDGVRTAAFQLDVVEPRRVGPAGDEAREELAPAGNFEVVATRDYGGKHYRGWCHVYYRWGRDSDKLRKPVLLAEGFPGGHQANDIYNYFDGYTDEGWNPNAKLANALRDRGHDVIILIFSEVGAPVQGNAFVYMRALQMIRDRLAQPGDEITAAGGSMGGLIARYALAYAEHHSQGVGNVRKLITFDSPHVGANVPMSVQATARFFDNRAASTVELLNHTCAKQMLMHQEWNTGVQEPVVKKSYTNFYAELKALRNGGYPTGPERYAISNGAREGGAFVPPESVALTAERRWGIDIHYTAWLRSMPSHGGVIPRYEYTKAWRSDRGSLHQTFLITSDGGFFSRDGCPGGRAPHFRITAEKLKPACSGADVKLVHSHNCFVPANSALGIEIAGDPNLFKPSDLAPGATPFTDWYAPAGNQLHCTIDEGIKNWVLSLWKSQDEDQLAARSEPEPVS